MTVFDTGLDWLGRRLAQRLRREQPGVEPYVPSDPEALRRVLRPADVLLISNSNKLSTGIKYLTQSTWSHAALYLGDVFDVASESGEPHALVEVIVGDGCISAPLSKYERYHTRICRPIGLTDADSEELARFMVSRLGAITGLHALPPAVREMATVGP